jgi:hypothetical protein
MSATWNDRDEHDEDPAPMTFLETVTCYVLLRPCATLCGVVAACSAAYVVFAVCMGWRPF